MPGTDDPSHLLRILSVHDPAPVLLEDFTPLAQSLVWQASQSYWEAFGAQSFISGDVPFTVNNDGRLSEGAARIFLDLLDATGAQHTSGPLYSLDLGTGSGLFSKLFLDSFQRRCLAAGRDYYARLRHVVADASQAMLDGIEERGLLASHAGAVCLVAVEPGRLRERIENRFAAEGSFTGFAAVFTNYLLDVLPMDVFRNADDGLQQLHVRTSLDSHYSGSQKPVEPDAMPASDAAAALSNEGSLFELSRQLVFDLAYLPYEEPIFLNGQPIEVPEGQTLPWNASALEAVAEILECLAPGGGLLVNDYGYRDLFTDSEFPDIYHYGGSASMSVNFALMKMAVESLGRYQWSEPARDNDLIFTRLITRETDPRVGVRLVEYLGGDEYDKLNAPLERARGAVTAGRIAAARAAFVEALRLQPFNWKIQQEIATFLIDKTKDFEAGRHFVEGGLRNNPISPELWNLLGECELNLGRVAEARIAFEAAIRLNPREARGRGNLAKALLAEGRCEEALTAIAEAFVHDTWSAIRDDLFLTQGRVLDQLSANRAKQRALSLNQVRHHIEAP